MVPREWINEAGNGIEQGYIDYCLPLIQEVSSTPTENGLPRYARLKKVLAKRLTTCSFKRISYLQNILLN